MFIRFPTLLKTEIPYPRASQERENMKILREVSKKNYELTYLLSAASSQKEQDEVTAEVEKQVKKHKGKVISTDVWGKNFLSYKIKFDKSFHTEAVYTHLVIEFPTNQTQSFEKALHLMLPVMRHLMVVAEKV